MAKYRVLEKSFVKDINGIDRIAYPGEIVEMKETQVAGNLELIEPDPKPKPKAPATTSAAQE